MMSTEDLEYDMSEAEILDSVLFDFFPNSEDDGYETELHGIIVRIRMK